MHRRSGPVAAAAAVLVRPFRHSATAAAAVQGGSKPDRRSPLSALAANRGFETALVLSHSADVVMKLAGTTTFGNACRHARPVASTPRCAAFASPSASSAVAARAVLEERTRPGRDRCPVCFTWKTRVHKCVPRGKSRAAARDRRRLRNKTARVVRGASTNMLELLSHVMTWAAADGAPGPSRRFEPLTNDVDMDVEPGWQWVPDVVMEEDGDDAVMGEGNQDEFDVMDKDDSDAMVY